ncbi:MAG: DUF4838 domain-containing protein [Planctomycetia bacterium]
MTDTLMVGIAVAGLLAGGKGVLGAAQDGSGERMTLAQANATPYVITLADDATEPEKNAAGELAAYLKKVTGAEFAIVAPAAAKGEPVIAVGPGAARVVAPTLDLARAGATGLGDDGIVLKVVGKHLVLTGAEGAKRGTLYAVYEFLEREVGVRWWTPTEELVPGKPALTVSALDTRYVPPFVYRESLCPAIRPYEGETTDEVPRFAVRMRQNGHFPKIPAAWGGHYHLIGWCHTFFDNKQLMPPQKYFADHPDWYSEINGERRRKDAQLCLTNQAMLAELTRNVLERIRENPEAGIISVSQNDYPGGNCQCTTCKALDDAEGSPAGSLLYGINRVAEGVEKEFPGFFVETLAYQYGRKPPKTIRPRHNVIVRYSVVERSAVQPITAQINHRLAEDLQDWSAMKPNLYIWDYTANLENSFTPEPRAFVYGPDLRLYRQMGAVAVFMEHSHGQSPLSDFDELHTWLLSKLLWNPDQDDRALIREFLDGYYGRAGKALYEYQQLLADRVGTNFVHTWMSPRMAEWLDLDTMNRATELFDAAVAAVDGDPVFTTRVRRARIALDHQWLCGNAYYRYLSGREQKPSRGPSDRDALLADLTTRCREAGVDKVGYCFPASLKDYLQSSRREGERVTARFVLEADKTYKAFSDGTPMPLPPELAAIPLQRVVDVQEDRMCLAQGGAAHIVFDEQAVNHAAACIDAGVLSWGVQVQNLAAKGIGQGRWHAYAVIRVEALAKSGVAFHAGVYDSYRKRNLVEISPRLEGRTGGTPDPNVTTELTKALDEPITDGRYRLYDFGVHDFSDTTSLWVGTTGGVDPKNVKAIYVDRFIFVREP